MSCICHKTRFTAICSRSTASSAFARGPRRSCTLGGTACSSAGRGCGRALELRTLPARRPRPGDETCGRSTAADRSAASHGERNVGERCDPARTVAPAEGRPRRSAKTFPASTCGGVGVWPPERSSSPRHLSATPGEAPVHLGEHELDGSISPPVAQRFAAVMNGESPSGRQYRLVLRGELSDRFAGEFEACTWSESRARRS